MYAFRIMVQSGELCVIQRGMKFKVSCIFSLIFNPQFTFLQVILPDGPSRGCK